MIMNLRYKIIKGYSRIVYVLSLLFLFGVLSFGRSLSLIHINTPFVVPLFITELILLISLPLIIMNRKEIFKLPRYFLVLLIIYFVYGCSHMIRGIFVRENLFVLRDTFLCSYILFLPLFFIVFSKNYKPKKWFPLFIVSNIICIFAARLYFLEAYQDVMAINFLKVCKDYQFGTYLGISSSFLISILYIVKERKQKILLNILLALNFYMIAILGSRTLWISIFCLTLFLWWVLKKEFLKIAGTLVIFILIIYMPLHYYDFHNKDSERRRLFLEKTKSLSVFMKQAVVQSNKSSLGLASGSDSGFASGSDSGFDSGSDSGFDSSSNSISSPDSGYIKELNKGLIIERDAEHVFRESPNKEAILALYDSLPAADRELWEKYTKSSVFIYDPSSPIILDKSILTSYKESPFSAWGGSLSKRYKVAFDNISWRYLIWRQSLAFGLKYPWFGRGYGIYPRYIIWGRPINYPDETIFNSGIIPAHNHLLTIFYKTGLIGLVLFLAINISIFVLGLSYIKRCKSEFTKYFLIGSLGAFGFWHTIALFFDAINSPPTSIFLWILMALIISIIYTDKKAHVNE